MSGLSIKDILMNGNTTLYNIRSPSNSISSNIDLSKKSAKDFNSKTRNTHKLSSKEDNVSQIKRLVNKINEKFDLSNTKIELQLDKATKEIVVKIVDKNTGKTIRQIPPEELLKISSAFKDIIRGNLLNKKI